ncbi:MAG: isochorismatase family protein [Nitrososphaeraceae archaeon]
MNEARKEHKITENITKMKKLISFRRNKSIPIFYTQAVRKPSGINLLINDHLVLPRSREERLKKIPISVRGTLDADIIDEIKSTDEDHLLIKRRDSAFQDTEIGVWRSTA